MNEVFEEVRIGNWVIRGYIYEGAVILKAQNGTHEIMKKFMYEKVAKDIRRNYRAWVLEKFG